MPLVRRCLIAAASGLLSVLALMAFPASALCVGAMCLIVAMVVAPLVLFGAAAVAWVLMALARLRPAWPVALIGPVTVLTLVTTVVDWHSLPWFATAVAGSYVFAALVTADELSNAWRVALAAPVVVLFGWGVVLPIVL